MDDDCEHDKSRVLETRIVRGHVWRRRECKDCAHRWSTYEVPAEDVKFEMSEEIH